MSEAKKETTTVAAILQKKYATSSAMRLTSNEEFNRDAETMISLQRMYLVITSRVREKGVGINRRRAKLSEIVFATVKEKNRSLQLKTWGAFLTILESKPSHIGEEYWVRKQGERAVKRLWNGEEFVDENGLEFTANEWSIIYK